MRHIEKTASELQSLSCLYPQMCVQIDYFFFFNHHPYSTCSPTHWLFVSDVPIPDAGTRFETNAVAQIASEISSSNLSQQK